MTWKAKVEEAAQLVDEGEYSAELIDIQDRDGEHGPMARLEFRILEDEQWEDSHVAGIANKKLSEGTKLGQWVAALLGKLPDVGKEVTHDALLGRPCRIHVGHKANGQGQVFANVQQVLPRT